MEESLIDGVRSFHCLWNVKHPLYKNRNAKLETWRRLAERTGVSADECQKKWKYLKDKFVRFKYDRFSVCIT
eukprot:m.186131 g.186131  ORF g.186131 m.186131 type:complete len:72 (+) comp39339_c0_seq8:104-319(+)